MLKQLVLDTIKKYKLIDNGEGIVVGVSGGYDSVCLLHILNSIKFDYNLRLYPVHINHMLRGDEALRDENFVSEFCTCLGLDLHIKRIDVAQKASIEKISLEEAGRNARYDEFNKIASKYHATKIAVAHSRNDQAETILMRIFRGTGLEGLRGIEYKRDNIIRPLLDADRSQIENYVDTNGLKAITDSSNLHTDYFRNRVRLNVIPEINKASGCDITENLLRLSKIVLADDDYLRYNSELYYEKALLRKKDSYVELDIRKLSEMHSAIRSRVLRLAMYDVCNTLEGIGFIHTDSLLVLIDSGRTGARVDLPHGMTAFKSYETLIFKKQGEEKKKRFEYILKIPGETYIDSADAFITTNIIDFDSAKSCSEFINKNENVYTKFINYNTIVFKKELGIVVRNRREGDIFKPYKSNGTKKLKEYLIDNKVPRERRDELVLVASGNEIIWIVENKISDNYKVTDNNKTVVMFTFAYDKNK